MCVVYIKCYYDFLLMTRHVKLFIAFEPQWVILHISINSFLIPYNTCSTKTTTKNVIYQNIFYYLKDEWNCYSYNY